MEAAAPAAAKKPMPRVASSCPYRVHVLIPSEEESDPKCSDAECAATRRHVVLGQSYLYCECGRSTTQPFCDGESHVGTDFTPTTFTVKDRQKWILLCGCKRTTSAPYCDGSHIHIDWAALEW